MKRLGRVLSLVLVLVLLTAGIACADTFKLVDTYPKDGNDNAAVDNFGIKLYFNQPVINPAYEASNDTLITIKDEKGEIIPTKIFYSDKEEGMVLVLADTTQFGVDEDGDLVPLITQKTTYTITVSEDFMSAAGETLGQESVITITTLDQSKSTKISTGMMIVMMVLMIFLGGRTNQKKEEKKDDKKDEKVNPYKESKKSGKSVEEIVAQDQKRKEKDAAKAAKQREKEEKFLADIEEGLEDEEEYNPYYKKVKGPRPISAGGSKYKTGRGVETRKNTNSKKK